MSSPKERLGEEALASRLTSSMFAGLTLVWAGFWLSIILSTQTDGQSVAVGCLLLSGVGMLLTLIALMTGEAGDPYSWSAPTVLPHDRNHRLDRPKKGWTQVRRPHGRLH